MKNKKKLVLISTLTLLFLVSYIYPQSGCDSLVGFEMTPRDTFGLNHDNAGDLIFTESGVDVYIDSMTWFSGMKGYFNAYVDTSICGFGSGKIMRFNNVSLTFDVNQINTNNISFIFWDLGGDENLQVNGGLLYVISDFWTLPAVVAPGVTCIVDTVSADTCLYGFIGKVILNGMISELRIAGQELWIDSVCIDDITPSLSGNYYRSTGYTLEQNYPNPFNSSTTISYSIFEPGFVVLRIYDIHGREIQELVNEYQKTSTYSVNFNAGELPGGVYYYKLQVNDFIETQKMLLLR